MNNLFIFTIGSDNFFYNNEKYIYDSIVTYDYISNKKELKNKDKIIKNKFIYFKFVNLKDFF